MLRAARQATMYIPTAAQLLDTITYIQVVNFLNGSAFFGHFHGGIQQRKVK
jgi:hypothetical protein